MSDEREKAKFSFPSIWTRMGEGIFWGFAAETALYPLWKRMKISEANQFKMGLLGGASAGALVWAWESRTGRSGEGCQEASVVRNDFSFGGAMRRDEHFVERLRSERSGERQEAQSRG